MEFLWQALRQVVFLLDQVTYGLIPSAYELIFYLANVNIATNDIFIAIINRIYLLLGIFMLFKVSFSIMQYIVDPNSFSDSSKGFGKLVTNALVSVVLLAMVPWIFNAAYELQSTVLLSNVIPRIILGDTSFKDYSNGKTNTKTIKEQQDEIHSIAVDTQFTIFSAFYTLNTSDDTSGYTACKPGENDNGPLSNVVGSSDMVNSDCWNAVKTDLETEIHKQGGTLKGLFKYCNTDDCSAKGEPIDERDFASFKYLLWWMKGGGSAGFTINYTPIISAIVGAYLLLLLVTFAIDIATRVFRLMFLQAVAPIAIVSYIDPKESTSNGRLHNWAVESLKVYVSLFLRLAVIYLAVQIIKLLTSVVFAATTDESTLYYNGLAPEGTLNIFVYIFLILGIFTFAKKLPEMIERIFNIKLSGELHLNPFKAINENAGTTALVGGAVGGALGSAAGGISGIAQGYRQGGIGGAIKGMGGFATGAVGGVKSGIAAKGKGVVGAGLKQGGRVAWNMNDRHGTTFRSRTVARAQQITGAPMSSYVDKQRMENYKKTMDGVSQIKKNAEGWASSSKGMSTAEGRNFNFAQSNVAAAKARLQDEIKKGGPNQVLYQRQYEVAQASLETAKKNMYKAYVDNGHLGDQDKAIINELNFTNKENKHIAGYNGKPLSSWNDIDKLDKDVKNANNEFSRSNAVQDHTQAEENAKRRSERASRGFFGKNG